MRLLQETVFSTPPLLAPALPFLVAGAALLLSHATAETTRSQAMVNALAVCLLAALGMLLLLDGFSALNITLIALAMLAATVVALPLLDRTRFGGITFAAGTAGIFTVGITLDIFYTCLPAIARAGVLHAVLITASVLGLAGSMLLPLHPARHTLTHAVRWHPAPRGLLFLGWVVLAFVLAGMILLLQPAAFTWPAPILIASLVAALVALIATRRARLTDCLIKTGEATTAGIIIAALVSLDTVEALLSGMLAAFFVLRSESIAQALRIDDPSHIIGAVVLPAAVGLLLPGLFGSPMLAPSLVWLGAALALGLALAVIVWPLAMLLFGFALPKHLLRGGP